MLFVLAIYVYMYSIYRYDDIYQRQVLVCVGYIYVYMYHIIL